MYFKNRQDAAFALVENLKDLKPDHPLVLAIPRGALPLARIVADELEGDLDVVLVHKFGLPWHPELALGSVTEEGDVFAGRYMEELNFDEVELNRSAHDEIEKLKNKRQFYTPYKKPIDPAGRTVVIVDDGIATGSTMIAAVRSLFKKQAARIIVAAPVSSEGGLQDIRAEGVETRILSVPENFFSVGQFYEDFPQVTDEEAVALLKDRKRAKPHEIRVEPPTNGARA